MRKYYIAKLGQIAQIRPEHRYIPVGEFQSSTNDATDPNTSTRSPTRDEQKHGRTPASPYGRNGEEKLFYQRTRTADEAFTGMLAASKVFHNALNGLLAARDDQNKSIKKLEEDNAWFDHQLERSELEQTKLEKKVDELSKALDKEKMAHEDSKLSFKCLWKWASRLEGQHELEVQKVEAAGRRVVGGLTDENTDLKVEIVDLEKRCTMLYEMLVQELQQGHKNKPAKLREKLKNLHSAFGDQDCAKEVA
ncbi:hypothetical protein SLS60_009659 [Paraconiothyrium brasiliense]|uniref:Uncharacterized protein n=1 Tax=Paraconiothyrium brasiliense TaxID=300254 RepID=A0ABR3QUY0_9PLEO